MVGSFLLLLFYRVTKRHNIRCVIARIVSSTCRPHNKGQRDRRTNRALPTHGRIEFDSHADTVVLGSNAVVAFVNYLSTIPRVEGVPLSYVVRANDAPDNQTDFGNDFISRSVACAPLQGAAFRADARKVHQLLMNFLVAKSAEQWIRGHVNQVNGRLDMVAL